ncbi:MAG TPA: alpha/beta hydrolase [Propionicimonas sp.]|jgi:pimeloyl-ACP methyl ester carboxylesterase|uniref:alpha/beta fold hydrolase n=1 Tax=Propionicimonas sp. TaxID=1955623 RepID=UPI002F4281E8
MTTEAKLNPRPIVLLGGYWLGPWAWAQVVRLLEAAGHRVEVPVLPGLGDGTPPEEVTLTDQADAVLALLRTLVDPVLVVHSGAGAIASAVTDRDPKAVARVVYVDSGPVADGQVPRPDLVGLETVPVPTLDELDAMGPMTADLSAGHRAEFVSQGVPQPGQVPTAPVALWNPARLAVPSTLVCCGISSELERQLAGSGNPMFAPTLELSDLDFVDLPGGHWPMWAQPEALTGVLVSLAGRTD